MKKWYGRGFFNLLLFVCLSNIFFIPTAYIDRFFTPGILWLGHIVAIFTVVYLIFIRGYIRLPIVGIYGIGLITGYGVYAWWIGTFSLQQISFLLILCLLVVLFANSKREFPIEDVCLMTTVVAVAEALWGIGQQIGWFGIYNTSFPVTGSLDNPAGLAAYLSMSTPFCFYFIFSHLGWKRQGSLLAAGILIIGILLSGSRTGLVTLGLIIIGEILYFKRKWNVRRWLYIGAVFVGIILFIGLYYVKKDSADGRLLIWRCTWEMIREKPLLGHGPATFGGTYMTFQAHYLTNRLDDRDSWLAGNVKHPFNEYLRILAEYGLVGFVAMGGGVTLLLRLFKPSSTIKTVLLQQDPSSSNTTIYPLKMSLLALAVCALFSYPLNYPAICALLAIVCGLIMREGKALCVSVRWGRPIGIMLTVALLVYIVYWKQAEQRWYRLSHLALGESADVLPVYACLSPFLQENALFLYNYGAVLHARQQWAKSVVCLKQCTRQLNDTDVQLLLADNYFHLKDYARAETCLFLASRMCPNHFLPLYRLVELYDLLGQHKNARYWANVIINKPVKVPSHLINKIKSHMTEYLEKMKKIDSFTK